MDTALAFRVGIASLVAMVGAVGLSDPTSSGPEDE